MRYDEQLMSNWWALWLIVWIGLKHFLRLVSHFRCHFGKFWACLASLRIEPILTSRWTDEVSPRMRHTGAERQAVCPAISDLRASPEVLRKASVLVPQWPASKLEWVSETLKIGNDKLLRPAQVAAPALVKYVSLFGSMTVSAQTLAQQVAKARAVQQVSMQPTQVSMSVRLRANDVTQTFSLLGGGRAGKKTHRCRPLCWKTTALL